MSSHGDSSMDDVSILLSSTFGAHCRQNDVAIVNSLSLKYATGFPACLTTWREPYGVGRKKNLQTYRRLWFGVNLRVWGKTCEAEKNMFAAGKSCSLQNLDMHLLAVVETHYLCNLSNLGHFVVWAIVPWTTLATNTIIPRPPCLLSGPYPVVIGSICGPATKVPTPTKFPAVVLRIPIPAWPGAPAFYITGWRNRFSTILPASSLVGECGCGIPNPGGCISAPELPPPWIIFYGPENEIAAVTFLPKPVQL